jgi:DNA-binding LytR/AlgR family response regulator
MIRCIIIDDEPYARQLLTDFVDKVPGLALEGAYASALQALPSLNRKPIDIIFLDIQMPDISGIDFLKTLERKPSIIFTTAFAEHALEGFELDVVDYLLKPFDFNRFLRAANRVVQRLDKQVHIHDSNEAENDKADFMFIKDGSRLVRVEYAKILFIKGAREYVTIYMQDRKIMSLQTLKNLEMELPRDFIRVHNSFIIYLPAVGALLKNELEVGKEIIPIGITYKKNLQERIRSYNSPGSN